MPPAPAPGRLAGLTTQSPQTQVDDDRGDADTVHSSMATVCGRTPHEGHVHLGRIVTGLTRLALRVSRWRLLSL
jgi:hypothetical protein